MSTFDHENPDPTELARWRSADSLELLGQATADWLLGAIDYHPADWESSPEEETTNHIDALAAMNRAGYVTDQSQPGIPPGTGPYAVAQRAFISGFCSEAVAARLKARLLHTELVVTAVPPGLDSHVEIVVTTYQDEEHTWVGAGDSVNLAKSWLSVGPGPANAVLDSWQLDVFDPVWGRNDLIWDLVGHALIGEEDE